MTPSRRFRLELAGACLLGLALQALFRWLEWGANPLARVPLDDAGVYWDWAAAIAGGRLVGEEPFLSAPLYPYFLGLLRALGLGLPGIYAVQALLQAATAWLLGRVALHHLRAERAAVVCAALFLLLADPAYAVGRLLNGSLQLLCVVGLWRALQLAGEGRGRRQDLALGAVAGLNVLANPAMVLALPLIAAWRWRRASWGAAARVLAPAALVIAPATAHNLAASGEPVLVSAQAGVTFSHGNAPGADGTYHPIPGVSTGRLKQNRDAYRLAEQATGEGGWRATSRYFFRRGLSWWADEPGAAVGAALRKLGLFFGAHASGDVALPELEREAGLKPWKGVIPAPLVLLPAALGLALALRRRRAGFAEALLFLMPLLVVAVFFYSPRYRMPVLPVAVVLTVGEALRRHRWRGAVLATGIAALVGGGQLEPDEDGLQPAFEHKLGEAYEAEGDLQQAAIRYRKAMTLGFPDAAASLGHVQRRMGAEGDGLETLRAAARAQPDNPYARRSLGVALAENGFWLEAEAEFRAAIALDPGDWEALTGLGNVLFETGRPELAAEQHLAAIAAQPGHAPAWNNLAVLRDRTGQEAGAIEAYEQALSLAPELLGARLALVFLYAGSAEEALRSSAKANEHARRAATQVEALEAPEPQTVTELYQALAAARAAAEDFPEAVRYQEAALQVAADTGAPAEVVQEFERRLQIYRAGEPFRRGG